MTAALVQPPALMLTSQMEVSTPRTPRWPWVAAASAFVLYTAVGIWLFEVKGYAIRDALSRTLNAKVMLLGRDPHLGAMGFYWMPLPMFTRVPFVLLFDRFGHAELGGAAASALFSALTIPVLAAIGRMLDLRESVTMLIVATYALSPLTIFMGANAMSEGTFGFFLALALLAFLRWRADASARSPAAVGLALAGAALCRYETIFFMVVVGVAVALFHHRRRWLQALTFTVLPPLIVFAWWAIASQVIKGDALYWLHASKSLTATPVGASWLPADRTWSKLIRHDAYAVVALAPSLVAVIAGLLFRPRQWRTSLCLVGVALAMPVFVTYQVHSGASWGEVRFYILVPLLSTICVMWLVRAVQDHTWLRLWGVAGVVLLFVGIGTGVVYMSDPRLTGAAKESVVFGSLLGRSTPKDFIRPGELAPIAPAKEIDGPFRQLDRDLSSSFAAGKRVAMDSSNGFPFLVTSSPKSYLLPEDREFERIMDHPRGQFDFIVDLQQPPDQTSPSGSTLLGLISSMTDGGRWQEVGVYGSAILYEWVETGDLPTVHGPMSP